MNNIEYAFKMKLLSYILIQERFDGRTIRVDKASERGSGGGGGGFGGGRGGGKSIQLSAVMSLF
jgi:hypothetical protein